MKAKKVMALVLCAAMVSGLAATTVMAAPEDQFEGLTANEAYEFPMMVKSFQSTYWEAAMKGMLDPIYEEKVIGNAEVRQTFKVSNVGTIAGCYVLEGKIERHAGVRVIREGIVLHDGKLESLKRFKDDVKEVAKGYECGIQIEKYNDIKEGDIIEVYVMQEVKR